MKKAYTTPNVQVSELFLQSLLETTSMSVGSSLTEGTFVGSSKKDNIIWDDDCEE